MQSLVEFIRNFTPLSDAAVDELVLHLKKNTYKKNDFLVREGQISRQLHFVEKGSFRGFYLIDHKEVTHWFGFENDFISSFKSFVTQVPCTESIQALEESITYSIGKETLDKLYQKYPELERLGRMACEQYYLKLEDRYVNSQFKTSSERYKELMDRRGETFSQISLGYIASFLGISQETLSRIRAKRI